MAVAVAGHAAGAVAACGRGGAATTAARRAPAWAGLRKKSGAVRACRPTTGLSVSAAAASGSAATTDASELRLQTASAGSEEQAVDAAQDKGWWGKTRDWLKNPRISREFFYKLGTSAILSYGFVSNINIICLVIGSWYMFTVKVGVSPLSQGQWGAYLLTYVALYGTIGNLLRPVRLMISAAIAPWFDQFVVLVQERLKVKQGPAIGITVFLFNGLGSLALLAVGMALAAALTGMPVLPPPENPA